VTKVAALEARTECGVFTVIDAGCKTAARDEPEKAGDEAWTIGRLLGWTTDFLKRKGSESPRLDAEVMLAHALARQRVELYTHFNDEVAEPARKSFRELVLRRAAGSPVAYLVGRKEFFSLPFAVSPDVLIPRPESEFVVAEYLTATAGIESPRCVDVGTGSGCLAIASAHQQRGARFVAIDISEPALAVAKANAAELGVADRIDFRLGDGLLPLGGEDAFDAIIANPPYIASDQIDQLEAGVKDYEPRLALDGGPGGLVVVSRLIEDAPARLRPGGHLILEIGSAQELPVRALIEKQPSLKLAATVYDHAKHPRVIHAARVG
jgi:release factor glutamine methyltransferase